MKSYSLANSLKFFKQIAHLVFTFLFVCVFVLFLSQCPLCRRHQPTVWPKETKFQRALDKITQVSVNYGKLVRKMWSCYQGGLISHNPFSLKQRLSDEPLLNPCHIIADMSWLTVSIWLSRKSSALMFVCAFHSEVPLTPRPRQQRELLLKTT